jgi:hypothetical protein
MDNFLRLKEEDRRVYFNVAADKLDVMPQLIEKDFWVCWILKSLFSLPAVGSHLTFKGGTSLSKCYGLIKRFSEDVDISIERPFLMGRGPVDPDKDQSGKENQRRLERLSQACREKISDPIIPDLRERAASAISRLGKWEIEIDPYDKDRQTVLFRYPHVTESGTEQYVQPVVKIEFGARADHWPVETMPVKPYIAEASDKTDIEGARVRVLAAERTFWEKATILHMIYHRPAEKRVPPRMSRHYYDVYVMAGSPVYKKALEHMSLLKDVAEHKTLFFRDSRAHYEEATPAGLRLLPREDQKTVLGSDYLQMQQMFFEEPPAFDEILDGLRILEKDIRGMKQSSVRGA